MKVHTAQVHRFRDKVALSLIGSDKTIYLTSAQAKEIAGALIAAAKSLKTEPDFCTSTFVTTLIK